MLKISPAFRMPLAVSIGFHLLLIIGLFIELPAAHYRLPGPQAKTKIVKAQAVSQTAVQKTVEKIKREQEHKQRLAKERVLKLQHQARLARQKRLHEQKRLAQIKLKQRRQRKRERARAKAEAAKRRAEQKAKAQALAALAFKKKQQKLATQQKALQQKLLQKQLNQEQKQISKAKQQQMQGVINRYKAEILQAIGARWVVPAGVDKTLSSQFLIQVAKGGAVVSVKLLHSSGDAALDRSARVAIYKASPLPVPKDPVIFDKFRELRLTVSPKVIVNG